MATTIRENLVALSCTGLRIIMTGSRPLIRQVRCISIVYSFVLNATFVCPEPRAQQRKQTEGIVTDQIELMEEHQFPEGGGVWTPIVFPFSLRVSDLSANWKD